MGGVRKIDRAAMNERGQGANTSTGTPGRRERVPALVLLLLSFFICYQSTLIGVGTLSQPGPGLLDFGAGLTMGGLALCLLIKSLLPTDGRKEDGEPRTALKGIKLLLVCISLFIYTLAVSRLGFLLSTFLFIIFILRMVESKPWWRTLLEAILITAGNYLIFVVWLDCSLPKGFLPW
jgi:hypothetical protein